jgi:hypothetical protein
MRIKFLKGGVSMAAFVALLVLPTIAHAVTLTESEGESMSGRTWQAQGEMSLDFIGGFATSTECADTLLGHVDAQNEEESESTIVGLSLGREGYVETPGFCDFIGASEGWFWAIEAIGPEGWNLTFDKSGKTRLASSTPGGKFGFRLGLYIQEAGEEGTDLLYGKCDYLVKSLDAGFKFGEGNLVGPQYEGDIEIAVPSGASELEKTLCHRVEDWAGHSIHITSPLSFTSYQYQNRLYVAEK